MTKGLGFRALHSHGRALIGLLPRAVDDVDGYHVREGELVSGVVNGWNFGDGHFHHEQLLEAVQEQCGFEEGEVRVIYLESQPAHIQRQRYRIYDAATGLVEEGWVDVTEMVRRGAGLDGSWGFPAGITRKGAPDPARPAAPHRPGPVRHRRCDAGRGPRPHLERPAGAGALRGRGCALVLP